jgi:uncharacterized phage protein (TIGR01671 family)
VKREIKFRVWDKQVKRMFLPLTDLHIKWNKHTGSDLFCEIEASDDGKGGKWSCSDSADGYEIMQYSGLKDKNGKDIYDGDIIQFAETYYYLVRYEDAKFVGYHANNNWGKWGDLYKLAERRFDKYNYVVIGNIYENPELVIKEVSNG